MQPEPKDIFDLIEEYFGETQSRYDDTLDALIQATTSDAYATQMQAYGNMVITQAQLFHQLSETAAQLDRNLSDKGAWPHTNFTQNHLDKYQKPYQIRTRTKSQQNWF